MRLLVTLGGAPAWAEGARRRSSAPPGSWRPSASAFRDFAQAAARRYSGSFAGLPRGPLLAGLEQANLSEFRTRSGSPSRLVPARPGWYRKPAERLLRRHQGGRRGDVMVTAGTAPFGDHRRGARRMDPAYFVRNLFCLRGRRRPRDPPLRPGPLRRARPPPYPIGPPTRTTAAPDDVVVPDIWKLTRPLRVALQAARSAPAGTSRSGPPRSPRTPHRPTRTVSRSGASPATWSAFYTLWRQGVDVVAWFLMRDDPRGRGYGFTLQSGVYFRPTVAQDGPAVLVPGVQHPFTAYRRRGVAQLWGLAPHAGPSRSSCGARALAARLPRPTRNGRLFFSPRRVRRGSVLRAAGQRDEPPLARLRERHRTPALTHP